MHKNSEAKHDDPRDAPSLEVLMASLYYLMTRYARAPCPRVSRAITEHLERLSNHADCGSGILRTAGRRLALQWREHLPQAGHCTGAIAPLSLVRHDRKLH